jgi:hypothetical protein
MCVVSRIARGQFWLRGCVNLTTTKSAKARNCAQFNRHVAVSSSSRAKAQSVNAMPSSGMALSTCAKHIATN